MPAAKIPTEETQNGVDLFQVADIADATKQAIQMILLTAPGERVMNTSFGVGLRRYLFEIPTPALIQRIKANARRQIELYGPPIFINAMDISVGDISSSSTGNGVLYFQISYTHNTTQTRDFLQLQLEA